MIKFREITKKEIVADLTFFSVSLFLSFSGVFLFDIHHSFYPEHMSFPPREFIFNSPIPYVVGILGGGIIGFFLFKLLAFAFRRR